MAGIDGETTTVESVVFVIDDDDAVRASLKSLFQSVGLNVEFSGLEFQSELVKAGTDMPIIFLTGHGDIPMGVQAMKAGGLKIGAGEGNRTLDT